MANYKNSIYDYFDNEIDTFPRSAVKTGTISVNAAGNRTYVTGVGTLFTTELKAGGFICMLSASEIRRITSIQSNTVLTIDEPFSGAVAGAALVYTPASDYCEMSVCIPTTEAAGEIDGETLPPGIGVTWTKSSRTVSSQRDLIDPIIIDATGTIVVAQAST